MPQTIASSGKANRAPGPARGSATGVFCLRLDTGLLGGKRCSSVIAGRERGGIK
ncbi:hypothetical protein [Flexibacterium corallicola]|uniref:hypothetical protein n=1 Tax=Flexibacterium corallicola TaxID=3037259 RepID=UPI00286EC880|nr:hypothetical protein [Pseudovibrio sp. M1P-2-3]